MGVAVGSRLGPYEVVAPIGAGGMGEVWRARDTRLDRTVAIKVLPAELAGDADRRARFEREARTISALQHPHICALFDVGEHDGFSYLVMEHLEGETLADRVAKGPLPPDLVLRIGREIAEALARAHRQGIVHRDLKPANVMLTKAGTKLLDFGLAKAQAPAASPMSVLSRMTTGAESLTGEGTLLGTFQYMAPEQLEAKEADARSDIWALGCVLHEMATGKKAFEGRSQASLIAAILGADPPPISAVQPLSPAALDRVVRTCLEKDPDERWQSAQDLVRELRWIEEGRSAVMGNAPGPAVRRRRVPVALTALFGLVAGAAATALVARRPAKVAPPFTIEAAILPPDGATFDFIASPPVLSPDGRQVAFSARSGEGTALWVRPIDSRDARPLSGTDGATQAFWSPDGRRLAFFSGSALQVVSAAGGAPTRVANVIFGQSGDWNADDVILYSTFLAGSLIRAVPAGGGAPRAITALDKDRGEVGHSHPRFLPDGRHFLFVAHRAEAGSSRRTADVFVQALDSPERTLILRNALDATFAAPGHLLWWWNGDLLAQPFDARRRRLEGEPFVVRRQVQRNMDTEVAIFSVSSSGGLALAQGGAIGHGQLAIVDRSGRTQREIGKAGQLWTPRVSPDGETIAAERVDEIGRNRDIWLFDVAGQAAPVRVTFDASEEFTPVWSPDGRQLAYATGGFSEREARWSIRVRDVAGSGEPRELVTDRVNTYVTDWRHGVIAHNHITGEEYDAHGIDLATGRDEPLVTGPATERDATFSPDGRWIAYTSTASGRWEVYVRAFRRPGGPWQVSTAGGRQPRWRRDGGELFFVAGDGNLTAARLVGGDAFRAGAPEALFRASLRRANVAQYDPMPDGTFLLNAIVGVDSPPITILQGWEALARRDGPR